MRELRSLWLRARALLGMQRKNSDFDAELSSHISLDIDEGVRAD